MRALQSTANVSSILGDILIREERPQANAQWSGVVLLGAFSPEQIRTISKLRELLSLPHNWDSYGSPPPTAIAVNRAIRVVLEITSDVFLLPRVVPVPGGGVQLEWSFRERELEIEIDDKGSVEYLKAEQGTPIAEGQIGGANILGTRPLVAWLTA